MFSFRSVAAVVALEELCCSSIAAPVSNVKSISYRNLFFILQHPPVLSLPSTTETLPRVWEGQLRKMKTKKQEAISSPYHDTHLQL